MSALAVYVLQEYEHQLKGAQPLHKQMNNNNSAEQQRWLSGDVFDAYRRLSPL